MFHCSKQVRQRPPIGLRGTKNAVRFLCMLCMIVLFSFFFIGCQDDSGESVADDPDSTQWDEEGTENLYPLSRRGSSVMAPVEFFYTVQNPLAIISEEITEGTNEEERIEVNHTIIKISGLVDKEVESRINERIGEVYEKLKSSALPPFRGIKTVIPENALIVSDYIYAYDSANFNNILSISFQRSVTYSVPNTQGEHLRDSSGYYTNTKYVSVQEPLNLDLSTGEEISLADVFADNADYLALLNDTVIEELNGSSAQDEGYFIRWFGLKLAEPFKGLSPDQKFCLRPNGISLIFDYDTPEFYVQEFVARTMDLSFRELRDSVAIAKRFYIEGESIFSSLEEPKKVLLDSGYSSIPLKKQEYEDGRVGVYNYVRMSSGFPEMLMENVMELANLPRGKIDELNKNVKEGGTDWSGNENGYLEQQVSADIVGHYATITRHINGGARDYRFFSEEYRTYDLDTGEELSLADIFTEGFDYIPLIRRGLEKKISDSGGLYRNGVLMTPEETQQKLDETLSGILEFCPASENIWIAAGVAEFSGSHREPLGISLTYAEIGYENLVVFDER